MNGQLRFVYNVEATPVALVKDFVHRLVDPETYPCRLCDITYGRFVKKPGWQLFVWSLPVASAFHTRDGFRKTHPDVTGIEFPAVIAEKNSGELETLISAEEFRSITSLEELKARVTALLAGG